MSSVKVSVIVPVYNTERYLSKCLTSLLSQSLESIEIIIVNDGSPDNSQAVIDHFLQKSPEKIKSFNKENGGLGSARNFGIERATGDFIGFVDSDDYVKPDTFEKLYLKAVESAADLIVCDLEFVDDGGHVLGRSYVSTYDDFDKSDKRYALVHGRTEAHNKLYKRDLFLKTGIRYPQGWFEDYPATLLLIEAAEKIAYVDEALICYVQRSGSIMDQARNFSPKSFDILKGTEYLVKQKHMWHEKDYKFFSDAVAPVYAFLAHYGKILNIKSQKQRHEMIQKWGSELNRILPGWEKSRAIQKKRTSYSLFKRVAFDMVIFAFRTGKTWFVDILQLIISRKV